MGFAAEIHTERLLLRPPVIGDLHFFLSLLGNAQTRRFLGGPLRLRQRLARFKAYLRVGPEGGVWVCQSRQSGHCVGFVTVAPHQDVEGHEISYQFHPSYWGQGLAREAIAAVLDHLFRDMGFREIYAETQSANSGSCHLLGALGFTEQRRFDRFSALQVLHSKLNDVSD